MRRNELTTYRAVIAQARAFRALRTFMAQVLNKHNLTVTEWLIIGTVIDSGKEGVRISELAHILGVEMPVITNLLHKTAASNWVVRTNDSDDRRAKRIIATPEGMERACDIEGELQESTKEWLSNLDSDVLDGYFAVVGALVEHEPQPVEV